MHPAREGCWMRYPSDPVGQVRLGLGLLVVVIVSSIAFSAVAGASTAPHASDSAVTSDRNVTETWRTQVDTAFGPAQTLAANGTVYSINNGTVDALSAGSGRRQWEKRLTGDTFDGTVDERGTLYASGPGFLVALEQETGATRWNKSTADSVVDASDGRIYVQGSEWIRAINADNGSTVWNNSVPRSFGIKGVHNDTVILRVRSDTYVDGVYPKIIRGVNASTGANQWNQTINRSTVSVVVDGGNVYALSGNELWVFEAATGRKITETTLAGDTFFLRSLAASSDRLYGIGTHDGDDILLGYIRLIKSIFRLQHDS